MDRWFLGPRSGTYLLFDRVCRWGVKCGHAPIDPGAVHDRMRPSWAWHGLSDRDCRRVVISGADVRRQPGPASSRAPQGRDRVGPRIAGQNSGHRRILSRCGLAMAMPAEVRRVAIV